MDFLDRPDEKLWYERKDWIEKLIDDEADLGGYDISVHIPSYLNTNYGTLEHLAGKQPQYNEKNHCLGAYEESQSIFSLIHKTNFPTGDCQL